LHLGTQGQGQGCQIPSAQAPYPLAVDYSVGATAAECCRRTFTAVPSMMVSYPCTFPVVPSMVASYRCTFLVVAWVAASYRYSSLVVAWMVVSNRRTFPEVHWMVAS
jgi:hypothetical protein